MANDNDKPNVVLITGASSGMGKETAKALINAGYTVYAAARRVEKMKNLEEKGAHIVQMDVTAVGFGARPSIFLRRVLSDRMFDRIMKSMA